MGIKQKLLFHKIGWVNSVLGNAFAIAKALGAGALFLALQRWPYSYYTALRWAVFIITSCGAFRAVKVGQKAWPWIFGVLAVTFNPVAPIYFARSTWRVLDVLAASVLLLSVLLGDTRSRLVAGGRQNLAMVATEDEDEPKPLPLSEVRKCAEQGNAAAQWSLAYRYYQGREVRKNVAEGLKWHRKVAEQGIADAQCSLGDIYAAGELVPQDNTEAMKWYRMAAGKDHAGAQWLLADCYAYGIGVKQDDSEAIAWSFKALKTGNENGRRLYELLMSKPYPDRPFNSHGNYPAGYDAR